MLDMNPNTLFSGWQDAFDDRFSSCASDGAPVFHLGHLIPPGRYELEKGIATVLFDNGASVTLTGPADVEFLDISSLRVFRGKITGEAPGEGIRLKVTTPDLEVIDLGTRFGLEIDATGFTEVHVLEGTVQITRQKGKRKGRKKIIHEGFATVLAPGENQSLQPTAADPSRFAVALAPMTTSRPAGWLSAQKNSFTGLMDEVFVYDRALGPDEIRHLFESNRIAP